LREIFAYVAEDDHAATGKFIRNIFHAVERLPSFPESGRIVPDLRDPSIREVIRHLAALCIGSRSALNWSRSHVYGTLHGEFLNCNWPLVMPSDDCRLSLRADRKTF
jgi:plasmid stabilization system protein ParE